MYPNVVEWQGFRRVTVNWNCTESPSDETLKLMV